MINPHHIHENLLQFIWQHRLYSLPLHTATNTPIQIIDVGTLNTAQGPDFLNAKIRIDNIILVGNIEIDKHPNLWKSHKHHQNPHFKNVILHIVWTNTSPNPQHHIPIIELQHFVPKILLQKYQHLMSNKTDILCTQYFQNHTLPAHLLSHFYDRLTIDRIENKTTKIQEYLNTSQQHWEQVFFYCPNEKFWLHSKRICF